MLNPSSLERSGRAVNSVFRPSKGSIGSQRAFKTRSTRQPTPFWFTTAPDRELNVEPKISGHPTLAHAGCSVSSSLRLRARFENLCPSEQHGFLDFVRWKVLERSPQPPPFTPQIVR